MVVRLSATSISNLDVHGRARRYARILMRKALAYFANKGADQLKSLRTYLLDLADSRPHVNQSQNWRAAANLLDRQGLVFNQHYQYALNELMEEDLALALPEADAADVQQAQSAQGLDGMSLNLIDIAEVERILLLDRVSQRFDTHYEAQIGPLVQRLMVLFDSDTKALQHNPFRPHVFVHAFLRAWEKSGFDEHVTEDMMLALDPRHCADLVPLYADLMATLSQAGIRPRSTQAASKVRKAAESASAPLPASDESAPVPLQGESEPEASGFDDLNSGSHRSGWGALAASGRSMATQTRQFLRRVGFPSSRPAPLEDEPHTQPAFHAADAELLGYLGRLQADPVTESPPAEGQDLRRRNVLRQLRDRDEVRGAPELDRGTVDALAEVFDYVLSEQAIPLQMKVVIGRLQIPVLKAAMIDRDFFRSPEHPARKLVDVLAQASIAWAPERGDQDPLYVRIESTVKQVLNEFEDDLTLFSDLLQTFTEFLFETEQQAQAQIGPAAAHEQSEEVMELAQRHAEEVIRERIAALPPDRPLAGFLGPFLTGPWCQVAARAWLQVLEKPEQWELELTTLDHLIWSTQAKISATERRELVQVLPDLVRNLNIGLDAIGWTGEARTKFTTRLIATHKLAIRMTKAGQSESVLSTLDDTSGSEVLRVLDQRRKRNQPGRADEYDTLAQRFARGAWFNHVSDDRKPHRCRLSWISPMRTRLLFTNRDGFDAFVRSEREVAAMLRLGRLSVIDQTPVVARALDQIMASPDSRYAAA